MSVVIWLLWWSFHSRTQASSSAKAELILHDDLRRPDPNPKLVWDHFLSVSETTAALRPEKTTVAAVGSGALVVQHNVSQSVTSPMHPFQTTHSLALSQQTQTDRHVPCLLACLLAIWSLAVDVSVPVSGGDALTVTILSTWI
ncbi:hypothetical protein T4D_3959 [Trichinella pseudospiralis]|uniref:Uncharacterized protein n=1 Tax=Trichinella pseudospiralis TaxID=6337 RepID=A0A0V1G0S1_TRIPS|nr:hypothetical protein T4D_3959 [Trichinella pseudospiralis]